MDVTDRPDVVGEIENTVQEMGNTLQEMNNAVQKIKSSLHERPIKIELEKTAKSGYRFSISYYGEDPEECLRVIEDVRNQLEMLYGNEGTKVKHPLGE